jgi:hypothetical protein
MKTLKKNNNKYKKFFFKYSGNKKYLNLKDLKKLMLKEFKLVYNNNVMLSCINVWGVKKRIDLVQFIKMFKMKEGFFKDIKL